MKKSVSSIKFRLWCKNNDFSAQDIANVLHVQRSTIYSYWSGKATVPDENKKKLEQTINLPIYEIFYSEELK